ncbi:MAG: DUF1330 domain-containing protein, partial [Holophagales bacterium]|nr:DUF1330 domain-containing protein [Holophagales bacterium]
MPFEMLVGLEVIDDEQYRDYRRAMTPILESYGGGFGYDFRVSEVLLSRTDRPINRVFTIYFPDEDSQERFFADPTYAARAARQFCSELVSAGTTTSLVFGSAFP